MRRKKFLFIIAMVFMLMLSGCGRSSTSEPITTTKFKSIMEENELEVTDKTDSAKDHSYQEIYVAVDEEKYSFEYYFMKNEKSATNVYKYAVDNLNKTVLLKLQKRKAILNLSTMLRHLIIIAKL